MTSRSMKFSTSHDPENTVSKGSNNNIQEAATILKKGGVAIYPTDTVMGIGCRWDREKSVERIYQIKSRPNNLPFPILLAEASQLKDFAVVTPLAQDLAKRYWPGGLTIVLKLKKLSPPVIARSGATWQSILSGKTLAIETGTRAESSEKENATGFSPGKFIGFRIPNSEVARQLITLSGRPIIGTSANFHGKPSVQNSKDLDPALVKLVDYVVKGQCAGGIESTVVDATGKSPIIIRKGAVNAKSLILKIDTVQREEVIVEIADNWSDLKKKLIISQQKGSQALLPAIVKILKTGKSALKDLTAIEVNVGPGSFTGTRIGVAVANALGFSLDIPVNGSPRGEAGKLGKIAVPKYEKSKFD